MVHREHPVLLAASDQAARVGLDGHVWRLAWAVTNFFARRGHWADWVRVGLAGVAAAARTGDRAAEAEAHRIVGGGFVRLASSTRPGTLRTGVGAFRCGGRPGR